MAGLVHQQIQKLMDECGKNNPNKISFIRTKLILKGIDPDKYGPTSNDSQEVLAKLQSISQTLIGA